MSKSIGKRSSKKGFFVSEGVMRAFERNFKNPSSLIKIWSRSSTILPNFVGKTASVYNGHKWVSVLLTDGHIGHKFGEFSPSKVQCKHSGKKKK
ncbi:30S ribosomal protein S19 [Alphaproteobacteria bacterium endosymbiont of Tiliacea citrago]|uniref:30S ribosomal protein S19 n=1 Tax=Alphaproteobacteria bacterium endosymbiont of Tiliacea citrago TaxID=3077944 RepID=UPI00313E41D8